MIYGYARISTKKQSIDRQIRNISAAFPDATIITEKYTGTTMSRPQWKKLAATVRSGDTIVFDSVSRMSRDAEEGFAVYQKMFDDGIDLVFLKEGYINTEVYRKSIQSAVPMTGTAVDCILSGINEYLKVLAREQIQIAFSQSEKEVSDLRQRTKEGIATARLNGKQIGINEGTKLVTKKSIAAKEIIRSHSQTFGGTLTDAECMKLAGVARNSYYKYKAEIKEEVSAE